MGNDAIHDRVHWPGFMKINAQIGIFLSNKLGQGECDALGQVAVCPTWKRSVQIAHLEIRKKLPAGVMDIDLRVGPLVNRIGQAVAVTEPPRSTGCLYFKARRDTLGGCSVGKAAFVGMRNHDQSAGLDYGVFDKKHR